MKKRIFSFVLAVLMIASLLPATALAADIVDSGTCGAEGDGSNLTWTLDSEGVLTISGSGNMKNYDFSNAPWYGSRSRVKSAVIAEGVTSIGADAFRYCTSLTSVTIPDSVTFIAYAAFADCESLTSVTIPNSVTSIGEWAFSNCTSLTSVTIPDSVTRIGRWVFYECTSLTSVTIPDSVTFIGDSAFDNCTSLTSVTIPDSVTRIGDGAFASCTSLTSVTIPDSVTSIGADAFSNCTSLTSVTIPDSVTSIGSYAFSGCSSLTSVTIPDSVTSIGDGAFYNCTSLTSVTIPDSVTYIGQQAFWYCTSLTSVTIPDSVTKIGEDAFYGCTALKDVYFLGTKDAWRNVTILYENEPVTENAAIHYFSNWTQEKAPTCTEPGTETSTCPEADCGKTITREIPALGHIWDEGKVTKPATATETGIRTYTCTRCDETKTETIPATGSVDVTQMFTDVEKGWAYPGIQYCVTNGLMAGKGDGIFDPHGMTTRAEFVQMLYSLHGKPEVSGALPFTDLPEVWYRNAVLWAYQTGVTSGTSDTTFEPYATVTRAQVATFLMKYAKTVCNVKPTWTPADLSKYPDVNNVPSWALGAMQDAVALGLINGNKADDGTVYLDPNGNAPREQVATILMQFCKNVKK